MGVKHRFFINLDSATERRNNFDERMFQRWRASDRSEVSPRLDRMMTSMWNYNRNSHLGRCACYLSHRRLLEHIVIHKLDDVLICEDDAQKIGNIPKYYPTNGIVYLGGFFHNQKMMDNTKPILESTFGINLLDTSKYRILMTMAYIIPKWEIAEQLLRYFDSLPRLKAIDIMLGNSGIPHFYEYPAPFVESGQPSQIAHKFKKSNHLYEWIRD